MTSHKIKTLVVEDEKQVRKVLIEALSETDEYEVIGEADSIDSAYNLIKKGGIDIIFMDIKIIGGLSFQLLSKLKKEEFPIPPVVIETGFRDYEFAKKIHNDYNDVVIYILNKPFYEDWVQHQEKILDEYIRRQQKKITIDQVVQKYITIQTGKKSFALHPPDMILVKTGEKTKGNTEIILSTSTIESGLSLTQLLQKLPSNFRQINRYEAINTDWVSYIDHSNREVMLRNGNSLLIGDSFYKGLCELFV